MNLLDRLPGWSLSVLDQGLIAFFNLMLSVGMARVGGVEALGTYALISATMLIFVGLFRTLVTEPFLASPSGSHRSLTFVRSYSLMAGGAGAACVLILLALLGLERSLWSITCLIALLQVVQDSARYAAYKAGALRKAVASDTGLLMGMVCVYIIVLLMGTEFTWESLLLGWLLGIIAAIIPLRHEALAGWAREGLLEWWRRDCRPLGLPLLEDNLAYALSVNVSQYVLAMYASKNDVGVVRVVTALYAPAALVFAGLSMWLVASLSKLVDGPTRWRLQHRATVWLGIISLVICGAVLLFGDELALLAFGADAVPHPTALWMGAISTTLAALAIPWLNGAKVAHRYHGVARARTVSGVGVFVSMLAFPWGQSVTGYLTLLAMQGVVIAGAAIAVSRRS